MNGVRRALASEFIGTAALLAIVVGSGIMGERLAGGNTAVALLANSIATALGLFALITCLAPTSGAHFNPVVSAIEAFEGRMTWSRAAGFAGAQLAGAILGVATAHAMFGLPLVQASNHARDTGGERLGEVVATFGLVALIGLARKHPAPLVAALVGSYIGAAYWFTSSTSFANPAVAIARSMTDTFAGIAPASVAGFVAAQLVGSIAALLFVRFLAAGTPR
jgi:glycerol uptake facilitator-like aquaporin